MKLPFDFWKLYYAFIQGLTCGFMLIGGIAYMYSISYLKLSMFDFTTTKAMIVLMIGFCLSYMPIPEKYVL